METQEAARSNSSLPARRTGESRVARGGGADGQVTRAEGLARGLGWFSIGLGVMELVAPRTLARWIGAKPNTRNCATLRALGVREVISGVGILAYSREPKWLWSRLGGDIMDVALLNSLLTPGRTGRARGLTANALLVGVATMDGLAAVGLGQGKRAGDEHSIDAVNVTAAITINRPPLEVYRFWRQLENLPRIFSHLESVRVEGERSHWRAKLAAGLHLEWSAELDEDKPNELISWRSLPGGALQNHGKVHFRPAPGGRGTELHVALGFEPPAGAVGASFAKLMGSLPVQKLRADLRRFKQVMETGSIMASDASVHSGTHPAQPSAPRQEEGK